jgi:hypothetical protein
MPTAFPTTAARSASFTGLDTGDVDLTAPVPNTSKIGVWRLEPSNRYNLIGLADDPITEQASSTKCSV